MSSCQRSLLSIRTTFEEIIPAISSSVKASDCRISRVCSPMRGAGPAIAEARSSNRAAGFG
jgi:hypothetical protein